MCHPGSIEKLHCDVSQANHGESATLLYFPNGKKFKIIILWPFLIHLINFLNVWLCASDILEMQLQSSRRCPCQSPVPCTKSAPCILPLLSEAAFEMAASGVWKHLLYIATYQMQQGKFDICFAVFWWCFSSQDLPWSVLVFWGPWSTCICPRPSLLFIGSVDISFSKHKARIPA